MDQSHKSRLEDTAKYMVGKRLDIMLGDDEEYAELLAAQVTDLTCRVLSIPKTLPHKEKLMRIELFLDDILKIEGSDILIQATWIPFWSEHYLRPNTSA